MGEINSGCFSTFTAFLLFPMPGNTAWLQHIVLYPNSLLYYVKHVSWIRILQVPTTSHIKTNDEVLQFNIHCILTSYFSIPSSLSLSLLFQTRPRSLQVINLSVAYISILLRQQGLLKCNKSRKPRDCSNTMRSGENEICLYHKPLVAPDHRGVNVAEIAAENEPQMSALYTRSGVYRELDCEVDNIME